ncbi:hypothetical protein JSE7799_00221 [Jannaschia seosinensis]|uniref:DUF202 domain-containing protein n=1 Tax=Jannaschia seosinensis TaxID=313367 RepID=A0A0M7B648_9RHOB|nr:DUF202 domain-containing protein [Jannaschia seosinensis]CUH12724.1 hypothetical protein JSE7799_00221 [Jannaschia seosinensis]
MAPNYLTRSRLAWISLAMVVGGLVLTFVATTTGLPIWTVPVGYFVALIGSALLFVGWIRWRRTHRKPPA